jgi:FkbM family methyltransferase
VYPDTYSQFDEQQAILGYFETHTVPSTARFLDIGAWDPKTFSNTRALYERGWSGVVIEPSPTAILSQLREYGHEERIEIVQAAVMHHAGPIAMQMTADAVSTSDMASYEKWKERGGFLGRVKVMAITWAEINLWFGGFEFVNIDAEGVSVDLFHAMVGQGAHPACVCVEFDDRLVELTEAATRHRYRILYGNGTNVVMGL